MSDLHVCLTGSLMSLLLPFSRWSMSDLHVCLTGSLTSLLPSTSLASNHCTSFACQSSTFSSADAPLPLAALASTTCASTPFCSSSTTSPTVHSSSTFSAEYILVLPHVCSLSLGCGSSSHVVRSITASFLSFV